MKKILLILALILLQQTTSGQCTVNVTNFGNNTVSGYQINGSVGLTLNTNNTITLNLGSNFSTASGPDVRAYLVKSNGASNATLAQTRISNLESIEFDIVACSGCSPSISPNGQKSFTVAIPNGVTISEYDKVFFYCLQFNAFWDVGSFIPFTTANCSVLSVIDEVFFKSFNIVPNPAQKQIEIKSASSEPTLVTIYNTLGKMVYKLNTATNKNIDISGLKSGLYILLASTKKGDISKKLVIN